MKLTEKQTDKILDTLKGRSFYIIDTDNSTVLEGCETISEEYFNEVVNIALKDE